MEYLFLIFYGMYLIFYTLKVTIFKYKNQSCVPLEDKFSYWGALPLFFVGSILLMYGTLMFSITIIVGL